MRASPRALQTNFALPYLQKRVENTPPMVLQIRFAIWLTLQIEVEALHICKPSHHFASTISAFHGGLPPHPARFLYARPPSLPRAPALRTPRARPPSSCRACPSSLQLPCAPALTRTTTEVDGAELTRTTTATNDKRGLGWAATGAKT